VPLFSGFFLHRQCGGAFSIHVLFIATLKQLFKFFVASSVRPRGKVGRTHSLIEGEA
jgi:hypothetical protein